MSIKRRVLTASLWSFVGNGGRQAMSFLIFIYLARQLAPADVGLIALAMVLVSVLAAVSRCGQVETLQRYVTLDDRVTNTAFWMLTLSGAVSGLAVLAAGAVLRLSPDQAALGNVLLFLAPLGALQAWNAVPEAMLKQRLDFRALAIRSWIATLAGGLLAVYLAYRDFGVYALVGQRLASAAVQTTMLWALVRWHPRFTFDRPEAGRLLVTGSQVMLATLSNVLNSRISDAITGLFLGPRQLGFLRLGWQFFDVIAQVAVLPVSSVALSSFSKIQENREQLKRGYLRLTQFMAMASLPMMFGLGAVADIFVPLVFGAKWLPAVSILQLLGFLMLAGTINYFFAPLMVAVGAAHVVLKQSIAQVFVTAVLLGIGARWGVEGVVIAYILRANVMSWYNLHAMNKVIGLKPLSALRTLMPPSVSSFIMVGVVLAAKHALSATLASLPLLILLIVIGAATYGAALFLGDLLGLWRGYVGGAARSLAGAFPKRGSAQAGKTA